MKYAGSCHCRRIRFEAEGEIDQGASCNCSICSRKGSLLWFLPRSSFRLLTPEDAASTYTFNKHVIQHRFCPTCGIHTHGEGKDRSGNPIAAVNLRCVEGLDLKRLKVVEFDGRAL
jgi:hypothetical protein